MDSKEFKKYRKRLDKTQKQMAELLGTSLKAIHSYEQGWRTVPVHVERQVYFLVSRFEKKSKATKACWVIKKCSREQNAVARPGSFHPAIFAGLLMGPFVKVRFRRIGKKR